MNLSIGKGGLGSADTAPEPIKPTLVTAVVTSATYGTVASFASALGLQPLDRLKTLSQQETIRRHSAFQSAKIIVQKHGVLDLWRGSVPTLLRVVPGVSLYFAFLEFGQRIVPKDGNRHVTNFVLGFISRSLAAMTLMPATVIKTRFESNIYRDKTVVDAAKEIFRRNGLRGLYKGLVPTVMRDAPFSGIYLMFYKQNTKLWNNHIGDITSPGRFTCGVVSGILACAATQPFDITKTQMQLYPTRFSSSIQVARTIYQSGGLSSFFNGFVLRASRRTAMSALSWTIFEGLWGSRSH